MTHDLHGVHVNNPKLVGFAEDENVARKTTDRFQADPISWDEFRVRSAYAAAVVGVPQAYDVVLVQGAEQHRRGV